MAYQELSAEGFIALLSRDSYIHHFLRRHFHSRSADPEYLLGVVASDIKCGDVVACMLGAANRDPSVFVEPERFRPERNNAGAHLGFATGSHMCIGFRLAKAEAAAAVETSFAAFPEPELVHALSSPPEGHEFHQPSALTVRRRTRLA